MTKLILWLGTICLLTACQLPLSVNEQKESTKNTAGIESFRIQLCAGRIKYAAYVGGGEWRATFEANVETLDGENLRDQCKMRFFWKTSRQRPSPNESGWISAGTAESAYPHGLMSIDGHWIDRVPVTTPPYWMRVEIKNERLQQVVNVVGMCNFVESVEKPAATWDPAVDLGYGLCDRVLGSTNLKVNVGASQK